MARSSSLMGSFPFEINALTRDYAALFQAAATKEARDNAILDCLLVLLRHESLANFASFAHLQPALLYRMRQLPNGSPSSDLKNIAKEVLNPNTAVGKFFLTPTEKKPPSLKREHGVLFNALQTYCELATEDDADFSFELAQTLNQLVKNRRKRSPKVVSALITLMQKSLNSRAPNNERVKAIFDLLTPKDVYEVNLRELVLNAYSPAIAQEFMVLLTAMMQHGLDSKHMFELLQTPMQQQYRHNATLMDLVSYLANDTTRARLVALLASCRTKEEDVASIRKILNKPLLSIGYVWSSETKFMMFDQVMDLMKSHATPGPEIFYLMWSQGILIEQQARFGYGNKYFRLTPEMQRNVLSFILQIKDSEEKALALTLAKTSELFPTERTRIEREYEAQHHIAAAQAPQPAPVEAPPAPEPVARANPVYYPNLAAPVDYLAAAPVELAFVPDAFIAPAAPLMTYDERPVFIAAPPLVEGMLQGEQPASVPPNFVFVNADQLPAEFRHSIASHQESTTRFLMRTLPPADVLATQDFEAQFPVLPAESQALRAPRAPVAAPDDEQSKEKRSPSPSM